MKKHSMRFTVGAVALALLMTGCSGAPPADPKGSPAPGGSGKEFTLGIAGIPPIFLETVAYVAKDKGYFKDLGVDVKLREFATSNDVGRAVTSGEIPAGMVGTPLALAMRSSGSPIVATLGFEASSYLIGSADPAVTDCASLKGKTIAVDAAGAPKALGLATMLASCGLKDSDVQAVGVGGTQSPDVMIAKQVDTAVMHPDELAMVQEKRDTKVVMRITDADKLMHFFTLIAHEKTVADKGTKADLTAVIAALRKAIAFVADTANSKEVAGIASTMSGRTPAVAASALKNYLAIGYWPTKSAGLSEDRLTHVLEQQVKAGNIKQAEAPKYADFVDLTIYEASTALMGK